MRRCSNVFQKIEHTILCVIVLVVIKKKINYRWKFEKFFQPASMIPSTEIY